MEVMEKINSICINYAELLIDCVKDEEFKNRFKENPNPYLRDRVGMKIPDNVKVVLDDSEKRWPEVYVKTKDKQIAVVERKLGIDIIEEVASNGSQAIENREKLNFVEPSKVDIKIDEALKESEVVVTMPFFDAQTDLLTEIQMDDAEIILTTCT